MASTSRLDEIWDKCLSTSVMVNKASNDPIEVNIKGLDEAKEQIKLLFLEVIEARKKLLLARYKDEDTEEAVANNEQLDLVIFHLDEVSQVVEAL